MSLTQTGLQHLSVFATLGTIAVTQQIVGEFLTAITEADPALVSDETLALASAVGARAVDWGAGGGPDAELAAAALGDTPFLMDDYHRGLDLIAGGTQEAEAYAERAAALERKRGFYNAHLRQGEPLTEHAIENLLLLWIGRVSPPGLSVSPGARLHQLQLVPLLFSHARLVAAFARSAVRQP